MKTFLFLILTWALVVNSLKPSRYSEWSIQRGIEDFVLNEVTDEVYVAATFLFHLDADLNTVSMFESNEITATNVIVSHASNTGFACSDLTGHCFLFNLTDVSEINGFEGTPFISASSASFPIDDMAILFLTLRGSESICFVLADERTGSIAYRLLIYPSFQFTTDSLSLPSFQEQFLGVPTGMPLRRSLSSYSLRGFVYFVNRHNDVTDFPLYVMRMCEDEDSSAIRISSLIEVRLTPCVASKKYPHHVVFGNLDNIYGEVLLVTFTTGELDMDSNVCVYTQLDIEITMNTTIQSCFDNSTDVSFIFPWFDTVSYPCSLGMPQSTCKLCISQDDTICRLYNYTGIPGVELVGYNHSEYGKATALTLLSFDEVDLVFVGNDVGDLYKFQLVNYGSITLIEDINLSNLLNEAFSKLIPASDCIYASRATLLYRVTLDNCNDYTTCQSCVDTIDPVCGYCSLTDTCTRKSDCASPDLSLRWITDNSSLCLSVNSIAPSLAQTGEDIELTLSIDNLPKLQPTEYYECVFVSSRTPVSRVTTLSGVSLAITGPDTPGESLAYCNTSTSFVIASDYEVINFSLYSTELNENFSFQEDSFTFYDCNKHSRCESCADSTAPCFWCVYDNICSHSDALCNLGYVEPNQNSTYCPAITNTTGHVHNGDRSVDVLELHTVNTVEPIIGFNYTCVYVYADNTSDVSDAVWMSEYRIDCDPPDSTYSQFNALLVGFFLVWGGDGFEINEDAINVTIFNCTRYSQSCSSCLGFGGEFGCGNCYQNPNRTGEPVCSLRGRCVDTFYDNTQPCPSAQITDFVPKSSHVFGGTFVNITGSDFGGNLDEIEVTVANEACEISFYDFRTRIDCVTQPSTEGNTGPIIVTVKGIPTQSDSNYTYSLPNITDVRTTPFPETNSLSDTLYGVKEGGTELVLYGTNLGIGSERNVFIQDIFPCVITDLGTTSITCETTEINNLETGIVSVRIDGYELRFQSGLFSYVNLEVSLTEDRFITPAGGFIVRVDVSDVRGLHAPYLEVFDALTSDTVNKPCEGLDVDEVVCESPAYSYSSNLSVYFVVDNLRRDLQGITPAANNPNCTQTYISRNNIIIQGMNFDLANAEDYVITTESPGGIILPCRIVTIATEKLECNPPEIITGTLTVKIGRSIECTFPVETNIFEQYGIYIVGSSSLFLLIVLTACPLILSIFVIRHYKRKKVREVKHLLNQYSKLESNIAKECKTAEKPTIYIAGFYPDSFVISAPNMLHTSQYTENEINNNTLGLLSDYNIKVVWRNTLCIERFAIEAFIEFLREDTNRYLVLLGPACSDPAAGVAQVSYRYGLSLLTFASRSPQLGNLARYPGFIRGNPSDANIVAGWMKYIQEYNWRRLAILNQQGDYFISTSQEAQLLLQQLNIQHYVGIFDPESIRFDDQVDTLLSRVDREGYRIIIINAYPNTLVRVLCHLKRYPALHPPATTIFLYGWYGARWYGDPNVTTSGECDLNDIQQLTNGAVAFNSLPRLEELVNVTDTLYTGKTPTQVYEELREYVTMVESAEYFDREFRIEEVYLYDTLWALALALNKTIQQGFNLSDVGDYVYNNSFNNALNQNIINLKFLGFSGPVSFVGNERYDGRIHYLEFVNGSLEFRGHMRNVPPNPSDFVNTSGIVFDDGIPFKYWNPALASDGIEIHPIHVVTFPLVLFLSFLATIYVTVVITIILVCWYKRLKPVTTSEPVITITILSGTYFLFIHAVMLPIDGRYLRDYSIAGGKVFCQSRIWLLAVSISIIFGGMLAKAGKFYIIVIKKRFEFSEHLKPIYIVMFPLFLVILDILYCITWVFVAPKVLKTHEVESGLMNPPLYIVTECISQDTIGEQVFLWLLIALKSVLVVIGLFLAYNLRKVTHKSLKYTGTITWTMYNTSICSLGIVLILLLVDNLELRYSLSALLSLIEGVVAATIVSGPILYYLIRDPHGDTFFNPGNKDFPEGKELLEMRIESLIKDNEALKREANRKSTHEFQTQSTIEESTILNDVPVL